MESLEAQDFYLPRHQIIFTAIREMLEQAQPVDYETLRSRLLDDGSLATVGGLDYIIALGNAVTFRNPAEYSKRVREKARARRMSEAILEADRSLKIGQSVSEVAPLLAQAIDATAISECREVTIQETFDAIEKYQEGTVSGSVPVRFDSLNQFAPGTDELVVIAARPSIGKTALAISLAEHMSWHGHVLFLTMEMGGIPINMRRTAAITGIPVGKMKSKHSLTDSDYTKLTGCMAQLNKSNVHVVQGGFSLPELLAQIRSYGIRNQAKTVIIDHLGKIRTTGKDRRDIELGHITESLARACKDMDITCFLLCQLNRRAEDGDNQPRLIHLRDSGRIEEDADQVWLLHRESKYRIDADNSFEIVIAKNRNGPTGKVVIQFDQITGKFWED